MRSGTSYFNFTLYGKNLHRFWPLWGLYLLIWLVVLPVQVLTTRPSEDYTLAQTVTAYLDQAPYLMSAGSVLALFFAVAAAAAVFGYLYSSRSACMMHSLPLRRESLFLTSYLSGLTYLAGPLVVVFGLTVAAAACRGVFHPWPLLVWLLMQLAAVLFFYSFAVFCAMFTGHVLALPAFYFILNFLAVGILLLVGGLSRLFLYGYTSPPEWASELTRWLTPISQMVDRNFWYNGTVQTPEVMVAYAVAGVVLALLALGVYRRRHAESAGDVVAMALVRPVFRVGVAFCSGLSLGMLTCEVLDLFAGGLEPALLVCVLLWTVLGWYAAEMLLQKSFRVFHRGARGAAVMAAAMLVLYGAVAFDPMGYERQIPKAEDVQTLSVSIPSGYPDSRLSEVTLTDPAQIAKVMALHQAVIDTGETSPYDEEDERGYLRLRYTLKSGATLSRLYHNIPLHRPDQNQPGTLTYAAQQLLDDQAILIQALALDRPEDDDYVSISVEYLWDAQAGDLVYPSVSPAYTARLLQALRADFEAGSLGHRYLFYPDYAQVGSYTTALALEWRIPNPLDENPLDDQAPATGSYSYRGSTLALTQDATHTLALLREIGIITDQCYPITQAEYDGHMAQRYPEDWEGAYGNPAAIPEYAPDTMTTVAAIG